MYYASCAHKDGAIVTAASRQRAEDAGWLGHYTNGDKPGVGYAFTDGPAPQGFVYVMDPDHPGDFELSSAFPMENALHLTKAGAVCRDTPRAGRDEPGDSV